MSLCLTVLLSLLPLLLPGAVPFSRYSSFDNLGGKTTMMQVRSIAQDSDGMIWFGTSKGLFSYDGYDVRGHSSGEKEGVVSCLLQQNDTLFVGGENKVL